MEKHFNLKRYKELLELEKNGKISSLSLELLDYQVSIERQISYNQKNNYFLLISQYLNEIISPVTFRIKFLEIEREACKQASKIFEDFQRLENFTISDDLEEFSILISEISTLCVEYDISWNETSKNITEEEFYHSVNSKYLKFQEVI